MTTRPTRNAVWQSLLDVARLVRYYEAMANRHRRLHLLTRFLLLGAAASGVAAVVQVLPASVQLFAGLLVALLVAWDFVSDYANKVAVLNLISSQCRALENEWRELWADANAYDSNDAEVRKRNAELAQELEKATARADDAHIRSNNKLNKRSATAAYRVVETRDVVTQH